MGLQMKPISISNYYHDKPRYLASFTCCLVFFLNTLQFGILRDTPLFQFSILLSIFYLLFKKKIFYPIPYRLLNLIIIFTSVLSLLISHDIYNFFSYLFFIASAVSVYLLGATFSESSIKTFLKFFALLSFSFSLLSLIPGFTLYRFSGFFDNPNGMGRFAAWTALFFILYIYLTPKTMKSKFINIINYSGLLLSLILLIGSNSRLSLISFLLSSLSIPAFLFLRSIFYLRIRKRSIFNFIFLTIALALTLYALLKVGFLDSMIFKFTTTMENGDFSQGRFSRWENAQHYFSFFGSGHEIYENSGLKEVHSNYIGQLVIYGLIPTLSLYSFIFFMSLRSFIKYMSNLFWGYGVSFSFFSFYLFYSVFETGFAILPIYLAIYFLGFSDMKMFNSCSASDYA